MPDLQVALRLTLKDLASNGVREFRREFQQGMAGVTQDANNTTSALRAGMTSISTQLANIQRAVIAYHSVMGALRASSAIIQTADDFKSLQARLKLATGSIAGAGVALDDVRRIAAANGRELGVVGQLYSRLAVSIREMGGSQADAAKTTEAVTLALRVSGAGTQEVASATMQLSQAFASGVLRGDEFNSVNEAAPRIMQAVADHLGVTRGKLREMAEDGKLTADILSGALLGSLEKLRAEAAELPDTMEQASARIKNAWTEMIARFDQSSGASVKVSGSLNALAANMDGVVDAAVLLGEAGLIVLAGKALQASKGVLAAGSAMGALGGAAGSALRILGGWPTLLVALGVAAYKGGYELAKLIDTAVNGDRELMAARQKLATGLGDLIATNMRYADTQIKSTEAVRALGNAEVKRYHETIQGAVAYYNALYEAEARKGDAADKGVLAGLAAQRDAYVKALVEMRPVYKDRIAAEKAHGKALKAELDSQVADVKTAMEAQKKEYEKALAALDAARERSKKTPQDNQDFLDKVRAGPERKSEDTTYGDAVDALSAARNAQQSGNVDQANKALERARTTILDLKKAGTEYDHVLENLAAQANEVATNIAKMDEAQAQQKSDEEYNKLLEMQSIAKSLEAIKIGIDQAAADAALKDTHDKLQKFANENPIILTAITRAQDQTLLDANYKAPEGKAAGGPITGPGPVGVDSQLIMAAPGEHMLTAREVEAAGGHGAIYRIRRALLSGALMGYAQGGPIAASSTVLRAVSGLPSASSLQSAAPAWPSLGRIDLGMGGLGDYPVYAEPDVAGAMASAVRQAARKIGRRS